MARRREPDQADSKQRRSSRRDAREGRRLNCAGEPAIWLRRSEVVGGLARSAKIRVLASGAIIDFPKSRFALVAHQHARRTRRAVPPAIVGGRTVDLANPCLRDARPHARLCWLAEEAAETGCGRRDGRHRRLDLSGRWSPSRESAFAVDAPACFAFGHQPRDAGNARMVVADASKASDQTPLDSHSTGPTTAFLTPACTRTGDDGIRRTHIAVRTSEDAARSELWTWSSVERDDGTASDAPTKHVISVRRTLTRLL